MSSTLDRLAYEAGRLLAFVAAIVSAESGPREYALRVPGGTRRRVPPDIRAS